MSLYDSIDDMVYMQYYIFLAAALINKNDGDYSYFVFGDGETMMNTTTRFDFGTLQPHALL